MKTMKELYLRTQVRLLKAKEDTTFKEIAESLLQMQKGSFYNFMNNRAKLSSEKAALLNDYINNIIN